MRTAAIERLTAGFGIVSVLVAIVLITIGVVALSSSSAFMVSLQTDAAERTRASAIALAYMEQVKTRLPASLATEAEAAVDETGTEDTGGRFLRSLTVVEEPDTPDAVRATVEVDYPSGFGRRRILELVTVIYVGNE